MVAIQRVILGLDDNFRTGDSWRFVAADYPVAADNWMVTFPEVYNANDLAANVLDADFVAIEMGNVIDGQGRTSLNLNTTDAELTNGQEHTIVLDAGDFLGLQTTLSVGSNLEVVNVYLTGAGGLNTDYLDNGLIGAVLRESGHINLTVRALDNVVLSEALTLTDDVVYQEGVSPTGAPVQLGLSFTAMRGPFPATHAPASAQNALYQNVPNPVADQTVIAFDPAQAGQTELTFRDVTGRLLATSRLEGVAGRNTLTLQRGDFNASGVVTYTVVSGKFTATRKMILTR